MKPKVTYVDDTSFVKALLNTREFSHVKFGKELEADLDRWDFINRLARPHHLYFNLLKYYGSTCTVCGRKHQHFTNGPGNIYGFGNFPAGFKTHLRRLIFGDLIFFTDFFKIGKTQHNPVPTSICLLCDHRFYDFLRRQNIDTESYKEVSLVSVKFIAGRILYKRVRKNWGTFE